MLTICRYGAQNTGIGCFPETKSILMDVFVPLYDSLGNKNYLDLADAPFDEEYFTSKLNESDASKRWYPVGSYKNPTDVRGDSLTQSFDDNTTVIIEEGARISTVMIVGKKASPKYLKKLKSFQNIEFGVYRIDTDKNFIGQQIDDNQFLYPIPMDNDSFDPIYNPGTSKEKQGIKLKMVYHKSVKDTNISMIAAEELDYDVSYLKGLLTVVAIFSLLNNNPGKFTAELVCEDFGTMLNPERITGLVSADFVLANITTPGAIVITSVTEHTDSNGEGTGIYDFIIPNQTANDVIKLTPTKNGFDFSAVIAARPVLV